MLDLDPEEDEVSTKETNQIARATDDTVAFVRNFFLQFFFEGYNFEIDGFNEDTISYLDGHFEDRIQSHGPSPGLEKPEEMINQLEEYVDLDQEVIEGEYSDDPISLKTLYCRFLPGLFHAFELDGTRPIANYHEVMSRIRQELSIIRKRCHL